MLVAVYAEDVDALCRRGAALLIGDSATAPVDALFAWLDDFVEHVASKRALALASGAALSGTDAAHARHLLALARRGLESRERRTRRDGAGTGRGP
ncbi:hypothetical protein RB614_39555 [Phytohabitans sp. ZYX-F-186]|uniref:Uncharacterized protein n=1 Tax=Phytohabitans maris TaxID=3071409 RepID=A0ABU0ZWN4_9ACTN|nr:hypothetical protein [Phytohabitans sp. ZYX-F-186]MDQ7910610.1 hypothetical protein [Phytohabitans sp. ZYX-F-186]